MYPVSILDLVPVNQGNTATDALHASLDVARHAEQWGYRRYWVAEHHSMPNIASSATAVIIGYLASGTEQIRIGSGGIMLPNHAPIVVAEQFGTLASLYPDRIDLGLGRAPGSDPLTMKALRRDSSRADNFANEVTELQSYFSASAADKTIQAIPGTGLNVPIWILGSSLFGAHLAAHMSLPYVFAAHFAPELLLPALQAYRDNFRPSETLTRPYAMVCTNVVVAETDRQAAFLFTTMQQSVANLIRGQRMLMLPPTDDIDSYWSPIEKQRASNMLRCSIVGSQAKVTDGLERLLEDTGADEIMVSSNIFDHQARLESFHRFSEIAQRL
jgi:luciferase family oxidoreductase group 1